MDSHDQSRRNFGLLKRLHLEILYQVIYTLPNADIKNLRPTCSYLGNISLQRFNRVFISPNPLDIEVLTLIANHDVFRLEVTEIIYDDSRFDHLLRRRAAYNSMLRGIDAKEGENDYIPHVKEAFKTRCTMRESWEVHGKLKSQQDEVLASGRDADALRYDLLGDYSLTPWDETSKQEWRGFCVVTKEIAQHIRENPMFGLSEFVAEGRQSWIGINCHMLDNPASEEYRDLVTILSHPPLRRLELSFACGEESKHDWPSFRSGHLFRALSKATNLQDLRFDTRIPLQHRIWHQFVEYAQNGMPLQSMFAISAFSNIRRLALSRSFVRQKDDMAFISTLPSSLESLGLNFLSFLPCEGTYRDLLQDMRCNLGWRDRPAGNRPKLIVLVVENESLIDGAAMDVSHAAMDYVYHHKENPFVEDQILEVLEGKGTSVDLLDPMHGEEL
ncbi:hypothetical protein FNAPI_1008 [Fusarium napiforme]|uniref:F-box domain-containing protein n=1 Tax=Fusarium napiforme TaxID=42672 RepID=A0A8H5K2P5_9HYPO|nr:hypothetical protein FNAPI_1008 [Fusarium napiforme]